MEPAGMYYRIGDASGICENERYMARIGVGTNQSL